MAGPLVQRAATEIEMWTEDLRPMSWRRASRPSRENGGTADLGHAIDSATAAAKAAKHNNATCKMV